MANEKLNVKLKDTGVSLYKNNQEVTSVTIKKDVKMEIAISDGFSAAAEISSFTLYEETNSAKGTAIGTWYRSAPATQPCSEIAVSTDGSGIQVSDANTEYDELDYFFSIQVTDGTNTYDTDPELKVKKATG